MGNNINRRSLITGLISFVAAPAIVRVESLMPVKVVKPMTHDEMLKAIMQPFLQEWEKRIADAIIYGNVYAKGDEFGGLQLLTAKDIYLDNS